MLKRQIFIKLIKYLSCLEVMIETCIQQRQQKLMSVCKKTQWESVHLNWSLVEHCLLYQFNNYRYSIVSWLFPCSSLCSVHIPLRLHGWKTRNLLCCKCVCVCAMLITYTEEQKSLGGCQIHFFTSTHPDLYKLDNLHINRDKYLYLYLFLFADIFSFFAQEEKLKAETKGI